MKCDKVFILELEAPDKEWRNNKGALINMYNDDHTHKGQFPAVELKNRYVFTDDELTERDNERANEIIFWMGTKDVSRDFFNTFKEFILKSQSLPIKNKQ